MKNAILETHPMFQIVYVTRNPRDTLISFYNHVRVMEGYGGSFETYVDAFLNDECIYWTPFMHNVREHP